MGKNKGNITVLPNLYTYTYTHTHTHTHTHRLHTEGTERIYAENEDKYELKRKEITRMWNGRCIFG